MANPHPLQRVLPEERPFHEKDALKSGIQGALVGGGAGLFAAAVQNSLSKANVGAWGVLTKSGGTIAAFTVAATVYTFSKDASANLRRKDDYLNVTIGSFLGGATVGLRAGRMPRILGFGAVFSVVMTAFEYTGGSLRGNRAELPGLDEYDRKEYMRRNRRRPMSETVAELGEGRGIEPPGYEERRRERLREKYGVEISPVSANVQ